MHADLKGALKGINKTWIFFEHNGKSLGKEQVRKVLQHGIDKGYKTTADFKKGEVDKLLTQSK